MSEVLLLLPVAILALVYCRGLQRLWERAGAGRVTPLWRAGCFIAGLVLLAFAVASPVDHVAGERLWAHMLQHVVLMAVVAPLLVLGNPLPTLLWALPVTAREQASAWSRRLTRGHARPSGWLIWVAVALVFQSAVLWAWHAPIPYEAALGSDWTHGVEHVSFLVAAVLFWWAVVGARRRSLYGPGVMVVFLAALQGAVLGAFMTLADSPWYPSYALGPGAGGLTPLEDQQVAGVIMWGPGGAIYLFAAVLLFAAWLGQADRSHPAGRVLVGGASSGT